MTVSQSKPLNILISIPMRKEIANIRTLPLQPPLPPPLPMLILMHITRQQNSMIQRMRQTTMPPPHLHSNNDQLRHRVKLRTETRLRLWIAQREPHRSIRGDNLEQKGEKREREVAAVGLLDPLALCDGDEEEPEHYVPQVKAELALDVGGQAVGVGLVFVVVDAEAFFFVDVSFADGDCDWERRDVHHYYEGDLDCGVECPERGD